MPGDPNIGTLIGYLNQIPDDPGKASYANQYMDSMQGYFSAGAVVDVLRCIYSEKFRVKVLKHVVPRISDRLQNGFMIQQLFTQPHESMKANKLLNSI